MANPFENKAAVGRDVTIFIAISNSPTVPDDIEFSELGAVRGIDYGVEWDEVDTTARGTSSGFSKTSLVTYNSNSIGITGLKLLDDTTQEDLEDHVQFPDSSFNNQPVGWARIVEPRVGGATRIRNQPVLFKSLTKSAPHDGEWAFNSDWSSQGDPVIVDVPAP